MSIAEKLTTITDNMTAVYNAGKTGGKIEFENMITNDFKRTNYNTFFCGLDFTGYTFSKTIYPTTAMYMFQNYRGVKLPGNIDFSEIIPNDGKRISYIFENAQNLEEIDITGMPAMTSYQYAFSRCRAVHTIKGINCEPTIGWTNTFNECNSLKAVFFTKEECIGNDINFQYSPIDDKDSLKNIVDALCNFSGTDLEYTRTITVSAITRTKLQSYMYNRWNTYLEMIENKGWII